MFYELSQLIHHLVGIFNFIDPGEMGQLIAATFASLVFLTIHMQANPYKNASENFMSTVTGVSLVTVFLWCTLLRTGILADPLTGQMTAIGATISWIIVTGLAGLLVLAGVLLALQLIGVKVRKAWEDKKTMQWAVCTMNPPFVKWALQRRCVWPPALLTGSSQAEQIPPIHSS